MGRVCPAALSLIAVASQERPALGGAEQRAFAREPKREHFALYEKA